MRLRLPAGAPLAAWASVHRAVVLGLGPLSRGFSARLGVARRVGYSCLDVILYWGFAVAALRGITGIHVTVTSTLTLSLSQWERGKMHA
jgi:hypothetical protein